MAVNHLESFASSEALQVWGISEDPLASGMTTLIFDRESRVEGVTVDYIKIDFMKSANLPGFKVSMDAGSSVLYEMDKLFTLTEEEREELEDKIDEFYFSLGDDAPVSSGMVLSFSENSPEFKKIEELFGANLANGLQAVFKKHKQKKIHLDIHSDQFLKDSQGNLVCVDAVMDKNIYREIQATN